MCCDTTYSLVFFSPKISAPKRESSGKWDDHFGEREWKKLMYSDCRGRLQHKGSFGFVQNAEKIVQVACCFFLTETSNAENKATVYFIFTDMPARTHTWSSSLFLFTVHYRKLQAEICVILRLSDWHPLPSLFSILKDFPVRQYAQAACDTNCTSIILCMCSFLEQHENHLAQSPIWAGKDPAGTYDGCDQRRLRRACVFAQSRQGLAH